MFGTRGPILFRILWAITLLRKLASDIPSPTTPMAAATAICKRHLITTAIALLKTTYIYVSLLSWQLPIASVQGIVGGADIVVADRQVVVASVVTHASQGHRVVRVV